MAAFAFAVILAMNIIEKAVAVRAHDKRNDQAPFELSDSSLTPRAKFPRGRHRAVGPLAAKTWCCAACRTQPPRTGYCRSTASSRRKFLRNAQATDRYVFRRQPFLTSSVQRNLSMDERSRVAPVTRRDSIRGRGRSAGLSRAEPPTKKLPRRTPARRHAGVVVPALTQLWTERSALDTHKGKILLSRRLHESLSLPSLCQSRIWTRSNVRIISC